MWGGRTIRKRETDPGYKAGQAVQVKWCSTWYNVLLTGPVEGRKGYYSAFVQNSRMDFHHSKIRRPGSRRFVEGAVAEREKAPSIVTARDLYLERKRKKNQTSPPQTSTSPKQKPTGINNGNNPSVATSKTEDESEGTTEAKAETTVEAKTEAKIEVKAEELAGPEKSIGESEAVVKGEPKKEDTGIRGEETGNVEAVTENVDNREKSDEQAADKKDICEDVENKGQTVKN